MNEKVEILKKSSTSMILEGEKHPWYNVKTEDNMVGWVFGKYVNLSSDKKEADFVTDDTTNSQALNPIPKTKLPQGIRKQNQSQSPNQIQNKNTIKPKSKEKNTKPSDIDENGFIIPEDRLVPLDNPSQKNQTIKD